jgi:hypothetical protein
MATGRASAAAAALSRRWPKASREWFGIFSAAGRFDFDPIATVEIVEGRQWQSLAICG